VIQLALNMAASVKVELMKSMNWSLVVVFVNGSLKVEDVTRVLMATGTCDQTMQKDANVRY